MRLFFSSFFRDAAAALTKTRLHAIRSTDVTYLRGTVKRCELVGDVKVRCMAVRVKNNNKGNVHTHTRARNKLQLILLVVSCTRRYSNAIRCVWLLAAMTGLIT